MNSNDIYPSTKVYPYVYKLYNIITDEFYIGYREANKQPSHIDLPIYKSSKKIIKDNFGNFKWSIIAEFFNGDSAYDFEQKLIYEHWGNPLLLNESCFYNTKRFRHTTKSKEHKNKISNALIGRLFSNEHKEKLSRAKLGTKLSNKTKELMSLKHKGHQTTKETRTKISNALKGNILSNEHKEKLSRAKLGTKLSIETRIKMSKSSKRLPVNKGYVTAFNLLTNLFVKVTKEEFSTFDYLIGTTSKLIPKPSPE